MSKQLNPGNPRQARKPIPFTPCQKFYGNDIECCGGVIMDVDVYTEGWAPDEVFRACPCNPNGCKRCGGSGRLKSPSNNPDLVIECRTCEGTGWKKSIGYQPPDDRYEQAAIAKATGGQS